jgi:LysM repeat protein
VFQTGVRYCGSWYLEKDELIGSNNGSSTSDVPTSTTSAGPTPSAPTQTGQPASCNAWYTVKSGDDCSIPVGLYSLTLSQFLAWNPAVSSDCTSGFWADYAYCVGVAGSSSSTPTTSSSVPTISSTTTAAAPSPTVTSPPAAYMQSGQAANCVRWDRAVSGDGCWALANRNGITVSQLAGWNTVLGLDGASCGSSFWLNYYYCVAVS